MSNAPITTQHVHTRVTLRGEDVDVARTVFCKRRRHTLPTETCATCAHLVSMPPNALEAETVACWTPEGVEPPVGLAELAARTPIGALVHERVLCVDAKADRRRLESLLLEGGRDAVPVLDAEDRPIGIVSKTNLLVHAHAKRAAAEAGAVAPMPRADGGDATAEELMTPIVHALPENAPLSFAIALLSLEKIAQVPIVSPDGEVTGLFTVRDAVRWFAQQMGYVVGELPDDSPAP